MHPFARRRILVLVDHRLLEVAEVLFDRRRRFRDTTRRQLWLRCRLGVGCLVNVCEGGSLASWQAYDVLLDLHQFHLRGLRLQFGVTRRRHRGLLRLPHERLKLLVVDLLVDWGFGMPGVLGLKLAKFA